MTSTQHKSARPCPFRDYVRDVGQLLDQRPSMPITVRQVSALTERLVADPSWLAPEHRKPLPDCYARYLLHRDRANRFVVLSLVWLPGQATPIHDHSCWGVMGLVAGRLEEVCYDRLDDGSRPDHAELVESVRSEVLPGTASHLLPPYREIHRIGNPTGERAISIHIYGRDLDEVNVFDPVTHHVSRMRIRYYNTECGEEPFII
jgi:predicted metal-dependent enzyme (double-stranded beta helix superfamily)